MVAISAGPVIWFGHLGVVYALAPHACRWGLPGLLHVITAAAVVLSALAALRWRNEGRALLAAAGMGAGDGTWGAGGPVLARQGADLLLGAASALAALFTMVVLVAGISVAVIGPCR